MCCSPFSAIAAPFSPLAATAEAQKGTAQGQKGTAGLEKATAASLPVASLSQKATAVPLPPDAGLQKGSAAYLAQSASVLKESAGTPGEMQGRGQDRLAVSNYRAESGHTRRGCRSKTRIRCFDRTDQRWQIGLKFSDRWRELSCLSRYCFLAALWTAFGSSR